MIVDVGLPDGSGIDFVRSVRMAAPHVEVAVITASTDPAILTAPFMVDAVLIAKPWSYEWIATFAERTRVANAIEAAGRKLGLSERQIGVSIWSASGRSHEDCGRHGGTGANASMIRLSRTVRDTRGAE